MSSSEPTSSGASQDSNVQWCHPGPIDGQVDANLIKALSFSKDRAIVLSLEQIVMEFLQKGEDMCVFPCMAETRRALKKRYGITINASYSRMLAHKVAQYYRLKTMTPQIGDRKDPNLTKVTATWADDCPKDDPYRAGLIALADIPVEITEGADEDNRTRRSSTSSSVLSFSSRRDSISSMGQILPQISNSTLSKLSQSGAKGTTTSLSAIDSSLPEDGWPDSPKRQSPSPQPSTQLNEAQKKITSPPTAPPSAPAPAPAPVPAPAPALAPALAAQAVASVRTSPSPPPPLQEQESVRSSPSPSPPPPPPPPPPPLPMREESVRTIGSEYSYSSAKSYPSQFAYQQAIPSGYVAAPMHQGGGMQLIGYVAVPPSPSAHPSMIGWQQPQMMYPPMSPQHYPPPPNNMYYDMDRTSPASSGTPRMTGGGGGGSDYGHGTRNSRLSSSSSGRMMAANHHHPRQQPPRVVTSLLDNFQGSSPSPLLTRTQASADHRRPSEVATPPPSTRDSPVGSAFMSASHQAQEALSPQSNPSKDLSDFPLPVALLCCPLSGQIFADPVIVCTSGHTYDRSSLIDIMENGRGTDPKTGDIFFSRDLVPNHHARAMVEEWIRWSEGDALSEDRLTG